jgi:hypothetical protein
MRPIDLSAVEEAKEFERVVPGGYVCGITNVKDVPEKEYLLIEYDIAEGTKKNYYRSLFNSKGFWGGSFVKSYKEKALPFFKGFITAVEKSNSGYHWDNDETKLKRKLVGLVLGEEEYQKNDGSIGKRLYVDQIHSVEKIRSCDYVIPELKKLFSPAVIDPPAFSAPAFEELKELEDVDDDDLPF